MMERLQLKDRSRPAPPRPPTTQTHVIIASPSIGSSGKPVPGKFDARIDERVLAEQSRTPFCDAARALLEDGFASHHDILIMRHIGSEVDALKANIGIAAKLTVADEPRPRFARWTPPETRWRAQ
jgi:hypothetical protein